MSESTAMTPYKAIETKLTENMEMMRELVPNDINFEATFKGVLLEIGQNRKLQECTVPSIVMAAMTMFELGLDCVKAKGHAYLVPYKGQCKLIIGYRGMIELAKRSGIVTNIMSYIVHEKDIFDISYGTSPHIEHKPFLNGERGAIIGAYAIAFFREGLPQFDYMTFDQLNDVKARSKMLYSRPWKTDEHEMYRKIPIRRLFKYLPSSEAIDKVIEIDNRDYASIPDEPEPEKKPLADMVTDIADGIEDAEYDDIPGEPDDTTHIEVEPLEGDLFKPKINP